MATMIKRIYFVIPVIILSFFSFRTFSQNTQIKGFIDGLVTHEKSKLSFGFGEQDLFIASEISDRLSFLGETVFRYTPSSPTAFSISVERVVIKYNIKNNHNLLVGKHHTPVNYWNDTYHHGRVFFPTIERPLLFSKNIIPLHTTGISIQGHDLGNLKFGYDLMVGNGLGSEEIFDNNKSKSLTAAIHIKPAERLRIGASYYTDVISKGSKIHDRIIDKKVNQNLFTGSVAFFGKKFEVLAESTLGINRTDSTGRKNTLASYIYTGYKITEKLVPYLRFDNINYQKGEIYYKKDNTTALVTGVRYQLNYLAVIKLEYQHNDSELKGNGNKLTAQFAIGF
jgi:hypothetical protein